MTTQNGAGGPFSGVRVLELADEKGQWCGKLLGDLGADVIKIEPPGGESTRTVGPFYQDSFGPERSLSFWHYNSSKRGVTLDVDRRTAAGCSEGLQPTRIWWSRRSRRATWRLSAWATMTSRS